MNPSRRRGSRIGQALVKTAPEGTVVRLEIRVERGHEAGPQVRLLLNGKDPLGRRHFITGNHPRDLFETGALLPTDPPRRVALYGCGCGIFGCSALTGLISRTGDQITWSDFYDFHAGEYDGPFHEDSTWPDPVHDPDADEDLLPTQLNLPSITFDAEQYLDVVHDATQGWSQECGRRSEWT
ncbi:hypothetical protein [Nocardioides aurantiacus]|uniref:hypothetical protein n=1 Tax=Nocardioides aurantiacus TaxID=86796 RepID=UPI0011CDA9E6|nr:hypothetical protein [Nocardioides aurantiacus]